MHIALLRAVNLPGRNRVSMADLRSLLGDLGFVDPRSLLASGNLVFGSEGRDTAELESMLETEARARLGLDTEIFVRTAQEWSALVEGNPFPGEAESDPGHLLVLLLKDRVGAEREESLRQAIQGREVVRLGEGPHAYAVYPDGIGRSKLTSAVIERHLGTPCTGRNWNTVLKLEALARET